MSLTRLAPFLLLASFLINGCADSSANMGLPYYNDATFTPSWNAPSGSARLHTVPPFSLTDQNGSIVDNNTVKNKIYVVSYFFTTCPGICPKMTKNLKRVQEAFAGQSDVMILSHSVTPKKDTVDVLAAYAKKYDIRASQWRLLTGPRDQIYSLGRHAYFVEEDLGLQKSDDEFIHTENIILVDRARHLRGIYNGLNKASVSQLIKDVSTLRAE